MGKIYKITNNINGKVYIGQTIQDLKTRFKRHCTKQGGTGKEDNMAIKRAILKYGKSNFSIEVLEEIEDNSLLNEREIFWIKHFNSFENGYNLTAGGSSGRRLKKIDKQHYADIIRMYDLGASPNEISKKYSVDRKTIISILKDCGVKIRGVKKSCLNDRSFLEMVANLIDSGLSQRRVAEIIGMSQAIVYFANKNRI